MTKEYIDSLLTKENRNKAKKTPVTEIMNALAEGLSLTEKGSLKKIK